MTTIRPYRPADRQKLLEVLALNVPDFFEASEIKDFDGYLDVKGSDYFTVEVDGEIMGGTGHGLKENGTMGEISWIFFRPDNTGQGLGSLAVKHCLKIYEQIPTVSKVQVRTSQMAYVFFEKFGFKLIKTEKDYWAKGFDLYEMMYER